MFTTSSIQIRSLWGWSWCWLCAVSSIIIEEIVKLAMILHPPSHIQQNIFLLSKMSYCLSCIKSFILSVCKFLSSCCESWRNTGMFGITNAYTHLITVSFSTSLPSSLLLFWHSILLFNFTCPFSAFPALHPSSSTVHSASLALLFAPLLPFLLLLSNFSWSLSSFPPLHPSSSDLHSASLLLFFCSSSAISHCSSTPLVTFSLWCSSSIVFCCSFSLSCSSSAPLPPFLLDF